jgi:hypothetical protein
VQEIRHHKTATVTVSLPEEVKPKLAVIGDREDRSVSHAARNLLTWSVYEFERRLERNPSADITPLMMREAGWLPAWRPSAGERRAMKGVVAGGPLS